MIEHGAHECHGSCALSSATDEPYAVNNRNKQMKTAAETTQQYRVNGNQHMTVELALPGQIVGVEDNRVILSVPVVSGKVLTEEASRALCDGMSDLDADIYMERVAHFAITESMRSRVSFRNIVTHRPSTPAL